MKTLRTITLAATLMAAPGLAFAMGCSGKYHDNTQAQSCAAGTAWDATTGSCVPNANS